MPRSSAEKETSSVKQNRVTTKETRTAATKNTKKIANKKPEKVTTKKPKKKKSTVLQVQKVEKIHSRDQTLILKVDV